MSRPLVLALLLLQSGSVAAKEKIGDAWSDARNPIVQIFKGQRLDLWSLRPIGRPEPPAVKNTTWPRGPLDSFVLARLEAEGLEPAEPAEAYALVRRLHFDLTGLPPTPERMARFLADPSEAAYTALVDELLGSRACAEHFARMWMDAARYSDSNGYDWDEWRKEAWRYRDYVVRSFEADKPFDRFITEQLAGDEMLAGPPQSPAEQDALLATGFLRMGPWDNSAMLFGEQEIVRAAMLADVTETTGSVFLGMTFSCCRCHDHKTEPLSQQDHYRLRACFAGIKFRDDLPIDLAPEQTKREQHNQALDLQIAALEAKRKSLESALQQRIREKQGEKADVSEAKLKEAATESEKQQWEAWSGEISGLEQQKQRGTLALIVTESGQQPAECHVLALGDPKERREAVTPGIPSVFDPNVLAPAKVAAPDSPGHRTALARWLVSEENPLTRRVLVNRFWQMIFGQGIVATPADFGHSGAKPTHPELLDWLARSFSEQGWSTRKLVRQFVTSATYRQSAYPSEAKQTAGQARDATNTLWWRANPKRLTAEQLRDALLITAGKLRPYPGGPPLWPELPQEILQANPAFLDDNAEKTKGWYPSPKEETYVRTLYMIQKRSVKLPLLETFDLPDNFTTCSRRGVSTVAPQALTLLNSPFAAEMAKAFAERLRPLASDHDRITQAWQISLQRDPTEPERSIANRFLAAHSLEEFARVVFNQNAFVYLD